MDRTASTEACLAAYAAGGRPTSEVERAAVKEVLATLTAKAPGHAVELRIPPYAAVQLVAGPQHRRGTPGSVVEMSARTLVELAAGQLEWEAAVRAGMIDASGQRADLRGLFPC